MRRHLLLSVAALTLKFTGAAAQGDNVLFIVVDDLRPQISGAYEQTTLTPNIARLQEQGVTFTRAYTQISLCSPSRTSLLTGIRPDSTRLWTIGPYFRNTTVTANSIVTLPQALKASGRNSTGAGKVWHPGTSSGGEKSWGGGGVGGDDMPWSFSFVQQDIDPRLLYWECDAWINSTGQSAASAGIPGGQGCVTSPDCVECLVVSRVFEELMWTLVRCNIHQYCASLACTKAHNGTDAHAVTVTPCADECYVDPMIAAHVGVRRDGGVVCDGLSSLVVHCSSSCRVTSSMYPREFFHRLLPLVNLSLSLLV